MICIYRFCESRRCFSLISPLNILHTFFCLSALSLISPCSLPAAVCRLRASLRLSSDPPARCVFRGCCASPAVFCCVPRPRALIRPLCVRPWSSPAAFCVSCRVSSGSCRHSSAIRRKTVWQCGQMHRVYVPGLASSCLCAAVACSVCLSVRVSCCLLSSGGNNSLYASISRAAAMRCSVCNVMLLLSIWIYTFCRVCPIRLASSTMPILAAFMCSRM